MFIIECPSCSTTHLVSNAHILSTHRTAEGIVAYVRCAAGHTVLHRLANRYPSPPPPDTPISATAAPCDGAA